MIQQYNCSTPTVSPEHSPGGSFFAKHHCTMNVAEYNVFFIDIDSFKHGRALLLLVLLISTEYC